MRCLRRRVGAARPRSPHRLRQEPLPYRRPRLLSPPHHQSRRGRRRHCRGQARPRFQLRLGQPRLATAGSTLSWPAHQLGWSRCGHLRGRIGRDRVAETFDGWNAELLRMGLLSQEMRVDSGLVKAHVNQREPPWASGQGHDRGGVQGTGHRDQADEVNGLFPITETTVDGYGVGHEETRYVQNSDGRFPPSPVDIDARWRTSRRGKRAGLNYRQNVIAWVWLHRLGVASSPGCGFIAWVWLHRLGVASSSAGGRFTGELPIAWVWLHRLGVASSPGCGFIAWVWLHRQQGVDLPGNYPRI